jgi:exocyst complex component 4
MGSKIRIESVPFGIVQSHREHVDILKKDRLLCLISHRMIIQKTDMSQRGQLCKQETHIEMGLLAGETITKKELIPSVRNLAALGSLYHSLVSQNCWLDIEIGTYETLETWFVAELNELKADSEDLFSPTTPHNLPQSMTPHTASLPQLIPRSSTEPIKLPLSREMAL